MCAASSFNNYFIWVVWDSIWRPSCFLYARRNGLCVCTADVQLMRSTIEKKKGTECVKSSVDSAIQHSNCRKHCKTLASRETLNSKLELKVNIGQKEILSNRFRKPLKIKQDRGMKRNSFALDL